MATESFFEDMVIDTPEAAANLTALIESGVKLEYRDSEYVFNDPEIMKRMHEKFSSEK